MLDVFSVGWVRICPSQDDPRPSILQLNTEGLSGSKITVIEKLAIRTRLSLSSYRRPSAQLQTS